MSFREGKTIRKISGTYAGKAVNIVSDEHFSETGEMAYSLALPSSDGMAGFLGMLGPIGGVVGAALAVASKVEARGHKRDADAYRARVERYAVAMPPELAAAAGLAQKT